MQRSKQERIALSERAERRRSTRKAYPRRGREEM